MSNLVVYRDKPLSSNDFYKLETLIEQNVSFREKENYALVWEMDEYGDRVQVKRPTGLGCEIFFYGELEPRLMEAVQRPAKDTHIGVHLMELAAHKPWGRGPEMWSIVVRDLTRDLAGVSEFCIVKACEKFRRDPDLKFFPDTAVLLSFIKEMDWRLKNVDKTRVKKADTNPAPAPIVRTDKCRRRVSRIVKCGMKPEAARTIWEQRFLAAIKRRGDEEKNK